MNQREPHGDGFKSSIPAQILVLRGKAFILRKNDLKTTLGEAHSRRLQSRKQPKNWKKSAQKHTKD